MAALDFPNSPTLNQTFTSGTKTWQWDGTSWNVVSTNLVLVAGSNQQVQFNDNGVLGAHSGFTYNKSSSTATLGNLTLSGIIAASVGTGAIVVSDSGILKTRTAAQILSEISAEPTITAGTTSQYWRGDKTWQALSLQSVTALGATTNQPITLTNTAGSYSVQISVDTNGNVIFNAGANQNFHFSGDVVAFSSLTPPVSTWWTSLPTASASVLGGIKIGTGLAIDGSGVVSVSSGAGGSVTSVGLSMPSIFNVSGSPVTGSGTLNVTLANAPLFQFFAGGTGAFPTTPAFRSITAADLPSHNHIIADVSGLQTSLDSKPTGSGTSGQVTYWSGTSTVSGSNNHFWDNSNNRLGIGTNAPAYTLDVTGSFRVQTTTVDGVILNNTSTATGAFTTGATLNGTLTSRNANNSDEMTGLYINPTLDSTSIFTNSKINSGLKISPTFSGTSGAATEPHRALFVAAGNIYVDPAYSTIIKRVVYIGGSVLASNAGSGLDLNTSVSWLSNNTTGKSIDIKTSFTAGVYFATASVIGIDWNPSISGNFLGADGVKGIKLRGAPVLATNYTGVEVVPTYNTTQTTSVTGFIYNPTVTSLGSGSTNYAFLSSSGLHGFGTLTPTYTVDINGNARIQSGALGVNVVPNATAGRIDASNDIVAYSSDRRLKENIKPITKALDRLKQLTGFTYNWNQLANHIAGFTSEQSQVGLFAQDVAAVLPEVVKIAPFDNDGNDGSLSGQKYLTVQYEKLTPLLIEGIKEQQILIEQLFKEIKTLKQNTNLL